MPSKLSPEWIKANKNLSDSMKSFTAVVQALDVHFEGMLMARKAQEAQDGPLKKAIQQLRSHTNWMHKELGKIKDNKNSREVNAIQEEIQCMFEERSAVWDTHGKEIDSKAQRALKDFNKAAKKAKDKRVKKILSKSKVSAHLTTLSKTLKGVSAARRGFGGHNLGFTRAYDRYETVAAELATSIQKTAATLKQVNAAAKKLRSIPT